MIAKLFKILAILILITGIFGGVYVLTEMEPKRPKAQKMKAYVDPDQVAKEFIAESMSFEEEYNAKVGINTPSAEDIKILESALASLNEYVAVVKFPDRFEIARKEKFNKIIDTFHTKEKSKEIDSIEALAKDAVLRGDDAEARKLYSQAINMQADLNAKYPSSSYVSHNRGGLMSREIQLLDARPLYDATILAEENAKKALLEKNWQNALKYYEEAISMQDKLNREFPTLSLSSVPRLNMLYDEYASLKSAPAQEEISAFLTEYEKAMASEDFIKAAEHIQDAILAQKKLNDTHPNSKFASIQNVEKWTVEKENAMTTKEARAIAKQIQELNDILKSDSPELAVDLIEPLLERAEAFRQSTPRNPILNDDDLLKLRYLNFVKKDIANIQKEIYAVLHNSAFDEKWYLMKCEVWQGLYFKLMQSNPSKNKASDKHPVEFVSREEVENFILRLSWILSKEVDLPTKEILISAIGDMKYVNLREIAWYDKNSDSTTQEVMTSRPNNIGFFDLLGNVAEYIDGQEQLMGGSASSNSDVLLHLGLGEEHSQRRSPFVGFRVMIAK